MIQCRRGENQQQVGGGALHLPCGAALAKKGLQRRPFPHPQPLRQPPWQWEPGAPAPAWHALPPRLQPHLRAARVWAACAPLLAC